MADRWELTPEQTPAFGPIAERFRRAGDLDRAVELCREGLAKFPNHLSGRVTLGWALLDLGRYDEARAELERVIKRAPDNLAAIRGLAELHDRAENAVFVPADAHLAWPPKPDAIETAGNGWVKDDGSAAEQLPSILAELEPLLPAIEAAAAGEPVPAVSLGDLEIRGDVVSEPEPIVTPVNVAVAMATEAVAKPAAEAATAETETETAPAPAVVATAKTNAASEPVAAEPVTEAAALIESGQVSDPILEPAAAVAEPEHEIGILVEAAAIAEPQAIPEPVVEIAAESLPEPIELTTPLVSEMAVEELPEPVLDLTADLDVDTATVLQSEFEASGEVEDLEPVLELTLESGSDPLLEAVEAVEMTLEAPEPAVPYAAAIAPDLTVPLDAAVPVTAADQILDSADATIDPALFELAAAADESALPRMDVIRDEVFELDQEPSVDMTALIEVATAVSDFHAPEHAAATPAPMDDGGRERRQAMYDLQLDAPALAPSAELPAHDFHDQDPAAAATSARDAHAERAARVSQDFAFVMEATRDFSSPHVPSLDQADPETAPSPEPILELEPAMPLPDPAIVFAEPAPQAAEASAAPEPPAVAASAEPAAAQAVTQVAPPPPPKPKKKPVAGLERFLRGIEGRKAKLARDSAA
jgi:hypothetical protein